MRLLGRMIAVAVALVFIFWLEVFSAPTGAAAKTAFAQEPSASSESSGKETKIDEYSRSAQVMYMQRFGNTGAKRGEEIYFMRCWVCHNEYTIKADPHGAPTLVGLYKRAALWDNEPVNDTTVSKQIREGSPKMPEFGNTLNGQDITDLVAYLRNGCCWDAEHPPANPRYRY
jgi:mono/diheme cytochrome c family protein